MKKPTINDLEGFIDIETKSVEIMPNGEVRIDNKPAKKAEILSRQAPGDNY